MSIISPFLNPFAAPTPITGNFGFAQLAQENTTPFQPEDRRFVSTEKNPSQTLALATDSNWVFTNAKITATNWNQKFPYQLMVLEFDPKSKTYAKRSEWMFTLPIPPEAYSISMPFSIGVKATLGGISEEHNGSVFRNISLQGSFGVLPNGKTAQTGLPSASVTNRFTLGIIGGTINSISQSAQAFSQVIGAPSPNISADSDFANGDLHQDGRGTGYFQFRLLQQFLEAYAAVKKRSEGKYMRLAFATWKDEAVYIVTPVSFDVTRRATDALGYSYSIQLKAWKRVQLTTDNSGALPPFVGSRNDPGMLQAVLNVVSASRVALDGASAALQAFGGDLAKDMDEIHRQTILFTKSVLGIGISLSEMGDQVYRELLSASAFLIFGDFNTNGQNDFLREQAAIAKKLSQQVSKANNISTNGGTLTALAGNQRLLDSSSQFSKNAVPLSVSSKVSLGDLQIKPATLRKINDEINRVRAFTRTDFEVMRDKLQIVAEDFADAIGQGSSDFNATFDRPVPKAQRTASSNDFDVLFALNNSVTSLSQLAVAGSQDNSRLQAIDFVAGLARQSGIAFQQPVSKLAVPFPYGSTLEQLSAQYLGDPNRWMEICTLNGLRTPYIDEEGFELPLLTNGRNNQIVIGSADNLHVGQSVTLFSNNVVATKRHIMSIDNSTPTMVILKLDGERDLGRFITAANAKLHAYLPDTVNSQMQIFVPSQEQSPEDLTSKSIPGINDFDTLLNTGGVDLLLTTSGDAAIDANGDWRLAIGLNNLVQRTRIALATPRGSLPQHPTFGLGLTIGSSVADLDAKELLKATQGLFANDPDFTGVISAQVAKQGGTARISVNVGVAGQNQILPISLDVR
ncbi:hypothetical protein UFOVP75_149 [uncultured Caudovirales phage]|uniref:Uncharacterized protein n=1 Tax=uncultured Caudovirales phage TaxID=2100421 RepID=A0A6J5L2B6_9CAUD|nr:hypothetical protein UFOVP75_149 [uncultured Caudovirales phage]